MRNLSICFFRFLEKFLILEIQQAMAVSGEVGILNLLAEFLTNALVLLCPFQTAGAVSTGALETLSDHLYHFFIFIQSDSRM